MAGAIQLIEEAYCPDVFVSGIGKIEKLEGGMVRVVFYSERHGDDGQIERVIVLKLVRPLATWAKSARMLASALTDSEGPLMFVNELPALAN